MEVKDIIRKRREALGLTYEQLGDMVGVGKSTVRKWETGMIENMKRSNIAALASALDISPVVLIGLDSNSKESTKTYELSAEETFLIESYDELNDLGKSKVINYTKDLLEMPKYKKKSTVTELPKRENNTCESQEKEYLMPVACHDDNLTDEEKENMNNIINDFLKNKK